MDAVRPLWYLPSVLTLALVVALAVTLPVCLRIMAVHYEATIETVLNQTDSLYRMNLSHLERAARSGEPMPIVEQRIALEKEKLLILRLQNESRRQSRIEDVSS